MSGTYDYAKVKKMILAAKGTRTTKEFAEAAGISNSALSMILTGTRKATIKQLNLLCNEAVCSESEVTIEALAEAAGYINFGNETFQEKITKEQQELEFLVAGILQKKFLESDISFTQINMDSIIDLAFSYTKDSEEKENWYSIYSCKNVIQFKTKVYKILSDIILTPASVNRTLVVVVDNINIFNELAQLAGRVEYRGNLQVTFLNRDTLTFDKEVILSQYK